MPLHQELRPEHRPRLRRAPHGRLARQVEEARAGRSGPCNADYVLRRLLVAIPSLLIASLIVFSLPRLIPGDVVQLMLEEKAYGKDLEDLRAKLGLNRPMYVQYVEWLGSGGPRRPGRVAVDPAARAGGAGPAAAGDASTLGVLALAFAIMIGVPDRGARRHPPGRAGRLRRPQHGHPRPVGTRRSGWRLSACCSRDLVGLDPAHPVHRVLGGPGAHFAQFLLPAFILGHRLRRRHHAPDARRCCWRCCARTTCAPRGPRACAERVVVLKHSLKNAMIPVVTVLGIQVAQIAGRHRDHRVDLRAARHGPFLVDAIVQRDYPVIQGINLLIVSDHRADEPARWICFYACSIRGSATRGEANSVETLPAPGATGRRNVTRRQSALAPSCKACWQFCRRKPLGAIGGVIVLVLLIMAVFAVGSRPTRTTRPFRARA